ncbi:MAG: bifunctional precorrin-2 dehydrogenase/sirohydrochlorin ferrochelatase [Proteobacteria bacterium]|nr:bifunctional precorrin-2 dehydrogenase/sirohydrochlorin ferrochelatase [Pseudomonadota bacterium]MBU4118034.1 bifunctional precorrin-2 dehydrogenase/sirohydrochlorin ferrochelatase [Pseudomonadota bacterium]
MQSALPQRLPDGYGWKSLTADTSQYFPVCLKIAGRQCLVIGGGRVGERKVKGLLDHGAKVKVISPELSESLSALEQAGTIDWLPRLYQEGDLAGAFLVIAATDDPAVQERVHAEAEELNILLNVADVPKWCNFILPATARRGDLSVSVSTAGKSPALASTLRQALEVQFGPEYGVLVNILGALRETVLAGGRPHEENKVIFARLADPEMAVWIKEDLWNKLAQHIREVLGPDVSLGCLETAKQEYQQYSGAMR